MSKLQARNEIVIGAPIERVWALITDINMLHKINPGVTKATGRMDQLGESRTCEIVNGRRSGTMTERLIDFVPKKKTVWTIESDTMGMGRMMRDTKFCFSLEEIGRGQTRVVNETYYRPANIGAVILNLVMLKRMVSRAQEQILNNIRSLTEK